MLLRYGQSEHLAVLAADLGQYGTMADHYRTANGWSVEPVTLTLTPDRHDGQWLRVRYLGYYYRLRQHRRTRAVGSARRAGAGCVNAGSLTAQNQSDRSDQTRGSLNAAAG